MLARTLSGVARVKSIGGIVSMTNLEAMPTAPQADPDIVNLNVRLFALLDIGLTVVDPQPQSMGMGTSRDGLTTVDHLEELVQGSLRASILPAGHRKAYWQRVVDELTLFDIHTDPETLQALPFELLVTREVRTLLDDSD
jgi:hypothetical protein